MVELVNWRNLPTFLLGNLEVTMMEIFEELDQYEREMLQREQLWGEEEKSERFEKVIEKSDLV